MRSAVPIFFAALATIIVGAMVMDPVGWAVSTIWCGVALALAERLEGLHYGRR